MQSKATNVKDYLDSLPDDRKKPMTELRKVILKNLPKGFEEVMAYGMIGYVVPFSMYPKGYHVNPKLPLGFLNIASQKNFIALYHMGLYSEGKLLTWFREEYPKHSKTKLDMGKACVRFKPDLVPYQLIGELVSKISPEKWVEIYEGILEKLKMKK